MTPYEPGKIEKKWQEIWEKEKTFVFNERSKKTKFYVLDMLPYVSSEGLHVGHPEGYTATEIIARYLQMRGWNVLRPMGWDAFGLPAENFAIKKGVHPAETTQKSIDRFRSQIKSIGLGYDWSREISTADPDYYKWTQWLFLYLYKRGLAYRAGAPVNWCPGCQTVLANEQVVAGECERCGSKVIQKNLEQWFFKITDYAERLLRDLDQLDWPENIKQIQRNWIGRSEGSLIKFALTSQPLSVSVFTTRPDTLFGATYLVLAPEHPILANSKLQIANRKEVDGYITKADQKTELERLAEGKEKTGVELKGIKAINPANNREIPIFISDYVLARYGTGAIMAVPGHDERDYNFAKKFNLPIKEVVVPRTDAEQTQKRRGKPKEAYEGEGILINSGKFNGMSSGEARDAITKHVGGTKKIQYKLRDWLISRQRYWGAPIPIIYCEKCGIQPVLEKDLPVKLPLDVDFKPTGVSPLKDHPDFLKTKCPKCQGRARREADTMDTFVDSSWYFLRYIDPKNKKVPFDKKKVKKIMPVDLYVGGAEHAVLHLLYARFVAKALTDGGWLSYGEPFLKLRNQGLILGEDGEKMSKSRGNVINPDEVIENYGADSFRMYEMFMGPFKDAKPWDTRGIIGVFRFLTRVWKFSERLRGVSAHEKLDDPEELRRLTHQTVQKVERDITNFSFNTAVSALMIFLNEIESQTSATAFRAFLLLLYPFAPHLAAEAWSKCNFGKYIHKESWPEVIEKYLTSAEITLIIQVDGKVRDTIVLPAGMSEGELKKAALGSAKVKRHLENKKLKNIVVIPDRLVNFVTR